MAVLNRQMFRQPFPVVRRQLGTPPGGEVQENKPFFGGVWGALRGMTSNTGWENQDQGKFAALIEKTDSMITIINKLVANRQITSDKGAELTDIITSERRKTNPNLQLLDDLYNQIVVGQQEFEEGYETWQKEDQQLKDDTMQAEEFMDPAIAVERQGTVDTTGIDPSRFGNYRNRQMGSPPMGEQVNTNNVGIMDGFEGEQVAQQVMVKGSAAKDEIDQASTYDELMQSIRGDDLSEHDRRQELASVVGEEDAYKTPDSVLALVQPVMQMMDTETANTGIGQIEEGQQMANVELPQRPVGIAHGGYLRKIPGYAYSSPNGVTQADTTMTLADLMKMIQGGDGTDLKTVYEEKLPLYTDILKGSTASPDVTAGQVWGDVSKAAFAWGQGASPGEAMNFLNQSLIERAALTDKEKRAMDVQLKLAALKAAEGDVQLEKTLLNKIKTEQIKQDKADKKGTSYMKSRINEAEHGEEPIYADIPTEFEAIAGLNEMIATLPEGTNIFVDDKNKTFITLPTVADSEAYYDKTQLKVIFLTDAEYDASPNKGNLTTVGEGTTWLKVILPTEKDHTKALDIQLFDLQKWIDKGYVMVPNSKVSIGHEQVLPGVIQEAEGGIVHRGFGSAEAGEIAKEQTRYTEAEIADLNLEEIEKFRQYQQQPLETPSARDDALALVTGGSNALSAIHDLKTLLSQDMTLAGMPGQVIESWRNIFLTLDFLDNEVLGDKLINKEGDLYKFMDKEQIEEVKALKQQIGDALADLRFMKGQTRMTPTRLIEESQKQADVTGWMMPPKVALQKLDALATRLAKLTKDYTVMSGVYLQGLKKTDTDYAKKYMRNLDNRLISIDNLVTSIHAIQVGEGDQTQKSYTIEELQQIIQAQ